VTQSDDRRVTGASLGVATVSLLVYSWLLNHNWPTAGGTMKLLGRATVLAVVLSVSSSGLAFAQENSKQCASTSPYSKNPVCQVTSSVVVVQLPSTVPPPRGTKPAEIVAWIKALPREVQVALKGLAVVVQTFTNPTAAVFATSVNQGTAAVWTFSFGSTTTTFSQSALSTATASRPRVTFRLIDNKTRKSYALPSRTLNINGRVTAPILALKTPGSYTLKVRLAPVGNKPSVTKTVNILVKKKAKR
jgi:hypothetical protein